MAWKAHIPGILDPNYPVARAVRAILDDNLDPLHRSERQLNRVIVDIRSHYGNVSEINHLTHDGPIPGAMPWDVFEETVVENVSLYRDLVARLGQFDPETLPPDTLLDAVHLLDRAFLTITRPRRPSLATVPGEFGEE